MTTTTLPRAVVEQALEALEALEASRRSHYYCDDTWYSCPKHEDGCSNEMQGDECNCGADEANEKIDQSITTLRAALAQQAEPVEPVAHLVALELERLAQDPPISGNTLAQARVLMTAANVREFGLGGGAPPQQAEPVEPNRWGGGHDIESPNNACMHKGYCMSLKQAREPMAQQAEPQPTTSMAEIQRLRAERDALAERLREVRALLADTTDAHRKKVVMNAWAEQRLARHGIPMPEGDPK